MNTWLAFWSILKKDIKTYYLKPPNISWGIIFPLSWTLMQFIQSAGKLEIRELLPGLICMSVLFGSTSMLAVTITFERKGRAFDRLLLVPISLNTMVLAKISGAILFGMLNALWPVVFATFLVDLSGINWAMVFMSVPLIAITSTLLGLLIAISAKELFEVQSYSNFFRFPMLFLSGLFFPIAKLPSILRPVSYSLPLTYGADMLNHAVIRTGTLNIWTDLAFLIGFAALLFYICQLNIKRKWIL